MVKVNCWEIKKCNRVECPAYKNFESACFYIDETECGNFEELGKFPDKLYRCRSCVVYNAKIGDEMKHFTHDFSSLIQRFKIFEEELAISENKYRNFFENNVHPILICNFNSFNIIDSNETAGRLYKYSKQEFLSLTYNKIANDKEVSLIINNFSKDSENKNLFFKKRIHKKKGGEFFFQMLLCLQYNI